jgi:hypothetical protein
MVKPPPVPATFAIGAAITALALAGCATLPEATKPAVICVYNTLKATPGIMSVDVYALDEDGIAITYNYHDRKGAVAIAELYVPPSNGSGRFQIVGDFMSTPDNPVNKITEELASKCHADGGYIDQVILTSPSKRVGMRKHVALPEADPIAP